MVKPHTYVNSENKVLVLRCSKLDGNSSEGFIYPKSGLVKAPDWINNNRCGHGLHGWPWGFGLGQGKEYNFIDFSWQVIAVSPENIVGELEDGNKCKFSEGEVIYFGEFDDAWKLIESGRDSIIIAMSKDPECKNISSGINSKAASSGFYSSAASSGFNSTSASFGDCSSAASSGMYSSVASSGINSTAVSSGICSKAASSGINSTAASSGDYSSSSSSGINSSAASSGDHSTPSSSGNNSKASSSGDYSSAASSGSCATAASSGTYSSAYSSGDNSTASSSGYSSNAASSGDFSKASNSGSYSIASSSGKNTITASIGENGVVKADNNGLLIVTYWDETEKEYHCLSANVGKNGIKPNTWYTAKEGKLVETV
jgi:hypothetical protein